MSLAGRLPPVRPPVVRLRGITKTYRIGKEIEVRALECFTAASIGVGGSELPAAERNARKLVKKEPYRESGYRLLMEALAKRGNCAEAIQVYEDLRHLLREGLGVNPSPATQELHKRLLREPALIY